VASVAAGWPVGQLCRHPRKLGTSRGLHTGNATLCRRSNRSVVWDWIAL